MMWCLKFISLVCFFSCHFGLSSSVSPDFSFYDDYKGESLGSFLGGSRGIKGHVYVLNATRLLVEGFQYSGEGGVFFMVGTSLQPSSQGADIAHVDDFNAPRSLGRYESDGNGKYVILRLPRDFSNYRWLSVFCMSCQMSFAEVYKPDNFVVPSPISMAGLSGTGVSSASATILDVRTIHLEDVTYDGSCPGDAYYWVGEGFINSDGYKALDETLRANRLVSSFSNQDVTVLLPKPLSINDINYIGVWCQLSATVGYSLGSVAIPSSNTLPAYIDRGYLGKYLGPLQLRGNVTFNAHGVRGHVYVINERTLYITDFSYDGLAPAVYVWGSVSQTPSSDGERFLTDYSLIPLEESEHDYLISHIPPGKTINDYGSISIWCQQASANFGSVVVPPMFEAPKPRVLGPLGNFNIADRLHNIYARNVEIIDKHTFVFEDMSYDGTTLGGFFYAGVGSSPDGHGRPLFWKMKDRDDLVGKAFETIQPDNPPQRPLPSDTAFDGTMDVYVFLPKELTVFEVGYIAIWDTVGNNLGHIEIPTDLCIPAYHNIDMDAYYNCEVLEEDTFNVHWLINEETEELEVTLVGRVEPGQYLAFGLSGSETSSSMIGGDVAVAWIDPVYQFGIAQDYYLSSKEPCNDFGTGGLGACPDEATFGQDNINLRHSTYYDGVATISYSRKLNTGDSRDKVIDPTDTEVFIIWGIGPVDSQGRILKHLMRSQGNHAVHFGREGSRCPVINGGQPPEDRPWEPLHIYADVPTTFKASIGPAGLKRGYEGITGRPGWGIAWYINGLLIPEITVRRGVTYTFEIYGGNNAAMTASYHPFYISADDIGGYDTSTPLERQGMRIFAGPGEGPLCEWKSSVRVSPDDYDSFLDYKYAALDEECMHGSPGIVTWTPDANTPDTVYYNCYNHRYLGWKINVQDFILPCPPNQLTCSVFTDTHPRCMDVSKHCDGIPDCLQADDELNCGSPCDPDPCLNGGFCLESAGDAYFCLCTGPYFGDDCEISQECKDEEYRCPSDGYCLPPSYLCDGEPDCPDASDESPALHNCVLRECRDDEYTCGNGLCIPERYLCDGTDSCGDNSDEGQLCVGVCGTSSRNISVTSTNPVTLSYQAPVNFPATVLDGCWWVITTPPGVRVYARILSFSVESPGVLYIEPEGGYASIYVLLENPAPAMLLDLISPVGSNGLYMHLAASAPFDDDAFIISFSTWTGGAIQTCSNFSTIQVLNSNQICDGIRHCFDGSDERDMCPCPPGVLRNASCAEDHYLRLICQDPSFCPPYGPSKICDINNCGTCTPVPYDIETGRRLTEAECSNPNCAAGHFTCFQPREIYFKCIPIEQVCDGHAQCADAADENGCPRRPCTEHEFTCGNGLCIPDFFVCNRVSECGDNSDEPSDCDYSCDPLVEFTCANGHCTSRDFLCDGDNDCGDNSDELPHNCMQTCTDDEFTCQNNKCVPEHYRCDNFDDCGDNSDEIGCCQDGEFECKNGNCVQSAAACNGVNDCGDQSDELGCGSCEEYEYLCPASGECLPAYLVCNDYDDCGNNADEQGCDRLCPADSPPVLCEDPCSDIYNICTSFGPEKHCIASPCGTCKADFYHFDGRKIDDEECERHGCQPGFFQCEHPSPDYFECLPPDYVCDGSSDCYDAADERGCDRTPCSLEEFTCANRLCVELSSVCDMTNDCGDLWDESDCTDPQCTDAFGRPLSGITVTSDDPCAVCRCLNGRRVCDDTITCPEPPYYYELCERVPREGQCCLEYDCSRVCFDDLGRPRLPGETIPSSNPCLICSCYNNDVECAIVDCPPIPATPELCVPEYKEDQCCPSYAHCKVSPSVNVAGELALDIPFTPNLLNPSSPEFRQLASDVSQELYQWFQNFHRDSLERVEVSSFRPGSVISSFDLHYYKPPGDIDIVGTMVTALLQSLVNTGTVGSYPVVPGPVAPVEVQATCLEGSFLCGDQLCISDDLVCDGTDNCGDGSDEQNCGDDCPIDACFTEYDPHQCGSDGVTYSNPCELAKAACNNNGLIPVYPWPCAACPIAFCTEQYDPQCGSDGVTYGNPCKLSQARCNNNRLTFAHEGECGPGCPIDACTTEYDPQCGSDGVTYSNPCELARAACSNNGLIPVYPWPCADCPIDFCTEQYDPQCGSDGVTYGNPCKLSEARCGNSRLTFAHEGECRPDGTDPCSSLPCRMGDICMSTPTSYQCCYTGFGGNLICQPTSDVCASSPCLNGATCYDARIVDGVGYQCQCRQGYTGPRCEHGGPDICPPGVPIVTCFVDPCDVLSCPAYPFANCVPNFCGGCNATFYDANGDEITNCFGCPMDVCTQEYDPQCGSDGVTYNNLCSLEQAKCTNNRLMLAYPGRCDIDCRNPMYEGYHIPSDDPCINCTCRHGERICLAVLCAAPPHELCVPISGPNVCCPQFDCSRVCINEFGQTLPPDLILPSTNPCQRCSCFGAELQCAIIDCPPPPRGSERCAPIYPPSQCCGLYDHCPRLPSVRVSSSLQLDLPFTPGLRDPTSFEYTQLAASLERELFSYLLQHHSSLERVEVVSIREGSVIPSFLIFYTEPPTESPDSMGSIEEQVANSLTQLLQSLVNSGSLGPYTTLPGPLVPVTVQVFCDATAFMCGNQNCIDRSQVCDGNNDCGDASDEQNCGGTCPEGVPFATCPAIPCNPATCPNAATCRQENCGGCKTLYFDRFGNPLPQCSACPITICTLEWDPQCGSDGVTYGNPCALLGAACNNPFLTLAHEGECDDPSSCIDAFGNRIPDGQDIRTDDPCETCTCSYGEIVCAVIACAQPIYHSLCEVSHRPGQCCPEYDCSRVCLDDFGRPRPAGETIPSRDPCVICQCNAALEINCAVFDCPVPPFLQPLPGLPGLPGLPVLPPILPPPCPPIYLEDQCCPSYDHCFNQCPPDAPLVNCFQDPCEVNSCPNYPNARCESNYCGGCNAVFFDHNGNPIRECSGNCPDFCTEEYNPQCGSDGMTYSNPCYFDQAKCTNNALYIVYPSRCFPCPGEICAAIYDPQCGSDGITYSNLCTLAGAVCYIDGLALVHAGECSGADPCSSTPCVHDGTCFPVGDGFRCLCRPGYSGPYCETPTMVNPCDRRPCQNGGICTQMGDLFICTCTVGYTGRLCEMAIQECPKACGDDYDPQCGSDGMTYTNLCHLERAAECLYPNLRLQYHGECTIGGCPPGVPSVRCFEDPCVLNRCPNYPDAKCVSHYCGGCYALFYDHDGSPISECNSCPITTCPLDYDPQCGSNGVTYPNPCALSAAACLEVNLEFASKGECESGCPTDRCTSEYEPVCGTNEVSYTNRCWLNVATCRDKSIQFKHEGVCILPPPGCPIDFCKEEYNPHCGSNGKTYSNACYLYKEKCEDPELELVHLGECRSDCQNQRECSDIFDPVCGSNGKTYGNLCELETQACFEPFLQMAYRGVCEAVPPPWPQTQVGFGPNNRFTVEIGDSGGMRGYMGITGNPSPGVSWYINGQLIPIVTVVRGHDYILYVSGGKDHGFYITNDEMGGYLVQTPEELRGVKIYAGPSYGPLCEWTALDDPDSFNTFEDFSRRGLSKTCESNNPAVLVWKPDRDTPDVLYYQSYNEKYVGWKIRVVDQAPPGGAANGIAYSTMLLAVSLITCTLLTLLSR